MNEFDEKVESVTELAQKIAVEKMSFAVQDKMISLMSDHDNLPDVCRELMQFVQSYRHEGKKS